MFLFNCDVHSYNTRSKNSFRLPYCRTNVMKLSLRFQGPKIFYVLTSEIQNASSTALFNSKLKSFFSWYTHTLALLMLVCSFWLLSLFFFSRLVLHYFFSPFLSRFALTRSAFSKVVLHTNLIGFLRLLSLIFF